MYDACTLPYPLAVAESPEVALFAAGGDADAADVASARSGDELAFERLVCRREREVYNLAWRLLGSREDALDAVQDTFLRVFRGLPSFRGDASFRTWLFGIALNVCRNRRASASVRARGRAVSLAQPDAGGDDVVELPLADARPDPEAQARGSELRRELSAALGRIAPEHREVLLLREMQGLEYEELAGVLACPLGTVKSRLARARAALRHELEGMWP